jgi:hypothetical protein
MHFNSWITYLTYGPERIKKKEGKRETHRANKKRLAIQKNKGNKPITQYEIMVMVNKEVPRL